MPTTAVTPAMQRLCPCCTPRCCIAHPTAAGLDYWLNQLNGNLQTKAQVLVGFSESLENQAAVQGAIQNGIRYVDPLRFSGTDAPDAVHGTAGMDTLKGLGGNDFLVGLAGDDSLDGGSGVDTAVYSSARATHAVSQTDTGLTVADSSGVDCLDTLSNIERLQFAHVNVAFDTTGSAGQAYRLYQGIRQRCTASHHLLNAERLALMRTDSLLVNSARAALVDGDALVAALQKGRPGFAALDVFEREPLPLDAPLRQLPNVLLTPHLGFVTEPVFQRFADGVTECLRAWLAGQPLPRLLSAAAPERA